MLFLIISAPRAYQCHVSCISWKYSYGCQKSHHSDTRGYLSLPTVSTSCPVPLSAVMGQSSHRAGVKKFLQNPNPGCPNVCLQVYKRPIMAMKQVLGRVVFVKMGKRLKAEIFFHIIIVYFGTARWKTA